MLHKDCQPATTVPFAILEELRLRPTSQNVWKCRRALGMINAGYVRYSMTEFSRPGETESITHVFNVKSASRDNHSHMVSFNGTPTTQCTCEDWRDNDAKLSRQGVPFQSYLCKHGIAARLFWAQYTTERREWTDSIEKPASDSQFDSRFCDEADREWRQWQEQRDNGGY